MSQQPMSAKEIENVVLETMERAGTHPALVYAFKKTGRIVGDRNRHLLSEEELKEWDDAIQEFSGRKS
jgi:hypothetical protein